MPQLIRPPTATQTKIKVVPKDGELEITLNINISVDGKVIATAEGAEVTTKEDDEDAAPLVPDFMSGVQLDFGKQE